MKNFARAFRVKPSKASYGAAIILLACSALSSPVFAAAVPQAPSADAGRAQQEILNQLQEPQATPNISIKSMALPSAPKGAEKVHFKFGGLRIQGVTVYKDNAFANLYQDKIGKEITLADVYDIANKMTLKYRNDGYVLTQVVVPPQTIAHGIPRLQVVEGFIDRIVVQPDANETTYAMNAIRQYAAEIKKSRPINVRNLERQLLLINDLPGVNARSILSPSKSTPGAADLLIIVNRKTYDAQVSVDDYGSRYLGPDQWGAAGTLNSVFGLNEAITGQAVIAQDPGDHRELAFGSLKYEMPVGPAGTKVSLLGSTTNTDPGFDLQQFDVKGRSNYLALEATQPFIRTRAESLMGHILLDWRDVDSKNNIEATRHDRIRAVRAGVDYQFLDKLLGVGANVVNFEISHGLDIFGGSDQGDPNLSRPDGNPNFVKATAGYQRLQRVTDSVNILLQASGQMSSGAQLSSEEFALGGISTARGFDPSEVTGDDGIDGRAEIQWKNPFPSPTPYLEKYHIYGFYDAGRVWNDDATTAAFKRQTLNSAGFGTRMNFMSGVYGDFALAFPLNQDVQTQGNKHPRLLFSLAKKF